MPLLTTDEIRRAQDIKKEKVPCPEWAPDGTPEDQKGEYFVYVRTMMGNERDDFEGFGATAKKKLGEGKQYANYRARMAVICCCDEGGAPLFTKSDLEWLTNKSAAALNRIVDKALSLSGYTEEDIAALEKNS